MIELLRKYAANGFSDFRGLSISGQIPVKQELINEVLAEVLQMRTAPAPTAETAASAIDTKMLLSLVKKVEVHADSGVLTVNFDLRV